MNTLNQAALSALSIIPTLKLSKLGAISRTMPSTSTSPPGHPDDTSSLLPTLSDSQTPPDLTARPSQKQSADCLTVSEGPSKVIKLDHFSSSPQQTDLMKPDFPEDFWVVSNLSNYNFFAVMLTFSATRFR